MTPAKPRLVYFMRRYDADLQVFLHGHLKDHLLCLREFFDVTVVNWDCNYGEVCDGYEPDLCLFELGPNLINARRLKIRNIKAHPRVPKLALWNCDAWAETRAGVLSEMDALDIETAFAIAVTAPEHFSTMADRLYVWPNFINPAIFKDYGEAKIIPVLFTGAVASQYPWRSALLGVVSDKYPATVSAHPGYYREPKSGAVHLHGEAYARLLNQAQIVPSCGTVAKEVVRKHFEIPACKALLLTESSPGLEAAGFRDMVNCVYAEADTVLDKLDYLFGHPDEMARITQAGYDLVHSMHTYRRRDQILQWFRLRKALRPGQRIVQRNPFGEVAIADAAAPLLLSRGAHILALERGDEQLWAGRYEDAKASYREALGYMKRLPEAKFRLALAHLYAGDPETAQRWLWETIEYTIAEYRASEPDPVEWAYYTITLLCQGKGRKAATAACQFPNLTHLELERARFAVWVLTGAAIPGPPRMRPSVHRFPERSIAEWVNELRKILTACGRKEYAERIACTDTVGVRVGRNKRRVHSPVWVIRARRKWAGLKRRLRHPIGR